MAGEPLRASSVLPVKGNAEIRCCVYFRSEKAQHLLPALCLDQRGVRRKSVEIGAETGGKSGWFPASGNRGNRNRKPGNRIGVSGNWADLGMCGNREIGKSG